MTVCPSILCGCGPVWTGFCVDPRLGSCVLLCPVWTGQQLCALTQLCCCPPVWLAHPSAAACVLSVCEAKQPKAGLQFQLCGTVCMCIHQLLCVALSSVVKPREQCSVVLHSASLACISKTCVVNSYLCGATAARTCCVCCLASKWYVLLFVSAREC